MSENQVEREIGVRLAGDDPSALDLIWDAYASDLLGYLVSILRSRHDAEDALQEVFLTIARKRASVAKARKLKPYLYRLARNVAVNWIRKNSRRRDREQESYDWLEQSDSSGPGDEHGGVIEGALGLLPEKQRTVIVMKFFRGKTFREIGEMLGVSENTAGSRYRYGMEKLREIIQETKL